MSLPRHHSIMDRVDELEEEVRQLRELLRPEVEFRRDLKLTESEASILSFICARSPNLARSDRMMTALYGMLDEPPDQKIIDVYVCKLRAKLKKVGVTIKTHWGEGYSIDLASRDLVIDPLSAAPRVVVDLEAEEWDRLQVLCKSTGKSLGDVLRACLVALSEGVSMQ